MPDDWYDHPLKKTYPLQGDETASWYEVDKIFGKEASGKSTLAIHLTKIAQWLDVVVVWADVEGTASEDNLMSLGADPNKLFLIQPEEGTQLTIEDVTERVKEIVSVFGKEKVPVVIVWDSLASTATKQELKEGFNHNQMGKLMPLM